ncbi:MAG: hypothetical protein ACR2JE_06705 [Acidobacteriaceae bacterium]
MQETSERVESNIRERKRRGYAAYLLLVLLLPLVCLLLAFPIARSQRFLEVSRRPLWHATDYRFSDEMRNCEVVIVGDSSGMIGVDPHVVEARTGWKTCNLAVPYMVTAVAGTSILDHYLAENPPPRFIVFHFSSTHLRAPALDEENGVIDAWLAADERFTPLQATSLFLRHPKDSLYFAAELWRQFLSTNQMLRPDWSGQTYARDVAAQRAHHGWMAQPGTAWDVVCGWQPPSVEVDRGYLDRLIARYSKPGTQVVIWENPSRACDTHIEQYRADDRALGLPPPQVYPIGEFADAFHLNTVGAARNSEALAVAMLERSGKTR